MTPRCRIRRFAPTVDPLDPRQLLTGGLSASLSHAVLSVQGTSPSVPIEVDIVPPGGRRAGPSAVIVPGLAQFAAGQVRRIEITGVVGEAITVVAPPHRARIPVQVNNDGPASLPATIAPATMSPLEQAVVDLTNQTRAEYGLAPLQANGAL